MNCMKLLLKSVLLLACSNVLADEVTCESKGNQQQECDMDTRGEVRLVRQLSKANCIEGQSWGLFKHSVWVKDGCRAVFSSAGGGGRQDRGGGYDDRDDDQGGAGGAPDEVTCESVGNRKVECEMNTSGEVRVVRQLSRTACVDGQNWGLGRHSVWVSDGCRAVFARDGGGADTRDRAGSRGGDRAPSAAIAGCNRFADQGYDGEVQSQSALKPGFWEVILRYEEYRYVCNVDSSGKVVSFDKIN
jgi:hypothetical protein